MAARIVAESIFAAPSGATNSIWPCKFEQDHCDLPGSGGFELPFDAFAREAANGGAEQVRDPEIDSRDWAGIFLRGNGADAALAAATNIESAIPTLAEHSQHTTDAAEDQKNQRQCDPLDGQRQFGVRVAGGVHGLEEAAAEFAVINARASEERADP